MVCHFCPTPERHPADKAGLSMLSSLLPLQERRGFAFLQSMDLPLTFVSTPCHNAALHQVLAGSRARPGQQLFAKNLPLFCPWDGNATQHTAPAPELRPTGLGCSYEPSFTPYGPSRKTGICLTYCCFLASWYEGGVLNAFALVGLNKRITSILTIFLCFIYLVFVLQLSAYIHIVYMIYKPI